MIIKSFIEQSSTTALKRVREEMGGEAIVLSTRQIVDDAGRRTVEITACLEHPTVAQSSVLLDSSLENGAVAGQKEIKNRLADIDKKRKNGSRPDIEQILATELDDELNQITRQLYRADVPSSFANRISDLVRAAYKAGDDITRLARENLVRQMAAIMEPGLIFKPGDRVVFVGPAGAGKSSMLARLAAHLITKEKRAIRMLTLDCTKVAAYDEVNSYASALGASMIDLYDGGDAAVERTDTITLIDTPALPVDDNLLEKLITQIQACHPTHCLAVFSALTRSADVARLASRVNKLSPTHLVLTMTDLTESIGTAVAAAESTGLRVALASGSPDMVADLQVPDPDRIVRELLQAEATLE